MVPLLRNTAISVVFTVFGGPGLFLFFLPLWITRFHVNPDEPPAQVFLAWLLISVGLAPCLESIARFVRVGRGTLLPAAPPQRLVVSGFYRYVRNPMYVGILTALAGEAILFHRRGLVLEWVAVLLGFSVFIRLHEEPALARGFPADYPVYKQNVRRWLPRLTPWRGFGS